MSVLGREVYAVNADAPAAAATYQSRPLDIRQDLPFGVATRGVLVDAFLFHEAQPLTWFIEGSESGNAGDWWILDTGVHAGHAAGGAGTLRTVRVPFRFVRIRVTNTGAAPATNFRVKMAGQTF